MRNPRVEATTESAAAVAACTRALANSPAAEQSHVATASSDLTTLRAAGDRVAVRQLFHDASIHDAHRPSAATAGLLFDLLEGARLDTLGTRWMPGVARNLMGHPGDHPRAIQWLAFEIFAEQKAPLIVAHDVATLHDALPTALLPGLIALGTFAESQPQFATAGAEWATAAASHGWAVEALAHGGAQQAASHVGSMSAGESVGEGNATDDPSERHSASGAHANRSAHRETVAETRADGTAKYTRYTTTYDRVIDAASLVDPTELARLRARLESELGETRVAITRLANRLRRTLMARQLRHWQFDLDEGVIDGSRLASVIASPGDARPFKRETDSPFPTAAVTLLIDHSGSMRGRPILMAALATELLVLALERCGVQCEVLGFTTRDWNGGRAYEDWVTDGRPEHPGRLNALEHIVLKDVALPWRRARQGLGLALHDEILKENIDGEAVQWAHTRLCRRPERRRILLVVSDGEPRDEATEDANGSAYLARHLRAVVEEIEDQSPIQIAAIGVGHDVLRFYSQAMTITNVETLGSALSTTLISLLTAPSASPTRSSRR